MSDFVDKKMKVGLFDSGIGGFSILTELFKVLPDAEYFYYSDDANAPYGPHTDEFITERTIIISKELFAQNVDIVVIACNTATASSIDALRMMFPDKIFVGVEPYLNAYYKMSDSNKSMVVLTTISTGRSERFKRLKDRIDPLGNIAHVGLTHLAKLIEDFYHRLINKNDFKNAVSLELQPLKNKGYTHAILGCTHYPLIGELIESELNVKVISPGEYVANRVMDLLSSKNLKMNSNKKNVFNFYSSKNNKWIELNRSDSVLPF